MLPSFSGHPSLPQSLKWFNSFSDGYYVLQQLFYHLHNSNHLVSNILCDSTILFTKFIPWWRLPLLHYNRHAYFQKHCVYLKQSLCCVNNIFFINKHELKLNLTILTTYLIYVFRNMKIRTPKHCQRQLNLFRYQ